MLYRPVTKNPCEPVETRATTNYRAIIVTSQQTLGILRLSTALCITPWSVPIHCHADPRKILLPEISFSCNLFGILSTAPRHASKSRQDPQEIQPSPRRIWSVYIVWASFFA
jgi:hypothetical protein